MASAEFDEEAQAKRPTVQVGDPFTEKLLLEACLELMGTDALVGIQDMGAAGLTSSSIEMAGRAGNGIELDLDEVPRRESGMNAYELMLSESQERMLLVAQVGREDAVRAICAKWDIDCAVVGRVTDTGHVVVRFEGEVVADLPVAPLVEGLRYERPMARPPWQDEVTRLDVASLPVPASAEGGDWGRTLLDVLGAPQVASKEWIWRQYDHMVRDGTVVRPGSDAAVLRILTPEQGDTGKGIALTTDCNSRFCYLDPYEGGAAGGGRGVPEPGVRGGGAVGGDRLPQLREPRAAGDHVAAGRVCAGARRCVPRARDAGRVRQREPLQ